MHIPVKGIQARPGGRVTVEFIRPIGRLDEDIDVLGPIHLKVTATNLGGRIGLEGYVRARVALTCSRCADEYVLELDEPIREFYVKRTPPPAASRRDERGQAALEQQPLDVDPWLEEEGADERAYSGDVIELDELVREILLLALPMKPVCREDCQGLCPVCGTNRNEGECDCREDDVDPRLAALKQWMETDADSSLN